MKSKRRHHSTSEESEDSEVSARSSSSESESEDSSDSDHRHKKRKKRVDSSESDSDSDDRRRSKKRKHKKKKKKHVKKKRRSDNTADSRSDFEEFSLSDGGTTRKKKHKKHKHKRSRSGSSVRIIEDDPKERRMLSVVQERRRSPDNEQHAVRTYYQKEYHRPGSQGHEYIRNREQEVQRFYRGSSKERHYHDQQQAYEERERQVRFPPCQQNVVNPKTFQPCPQFTNFNSRQPRKFINKRNPRYEGQRLPPPEEQYRRPREEPHHARVDQRGMNRYNQYEHRGPKRRDPEEERDFRERERRLHPPADPQQRYREREYPERRERFKEEPFNQERPREDRRDRLPPRQERPPPLMYQSSQPRSHSIDDRSRERARRPEPKEEGNGQRDERRDRMRSSERRSEHPRPNIKQESKERKSRFGDTNEKEYSWGKAEVKKEGDNEGEKEKPNFGLSGKLTADTNTVNGVVVKYTEPDDAKQPKRRWRFYPFKGDKALPILFIHRQSAFLIGRDKAVADIFLEHPSISKQHAVLQYRATPFTRDDGTQGRRVRPYIIDLESSNGTFVNNKKIEPRRYVELLESDVVKFGFSLREFVLLHENSKDAAQDDDNSEAPAIAGNVTTTEKIKQEKRKKQELVEDGE